MLYIKPEICIYEKSGLKNLPSLSCIDAGEPQ